MLATCSQIKDFNWWFRSGHDKFALADCLSSREVSLSTHVIMINERQSRAIIIICLSTFSWCLDTVCLCVWRYLFFFFFFFARDLHCYYILFIYCLYDSQPFYSEKILKIGPTIPLIHLKIILLQCFQFSSI